MPKISLPRYDDIVLAANRLEGFIKHTPVLTCSEIDEALGCEVFFKCENLQKSGKKAHKSMEHPTFYVGGIKRKVWNNQEKVWKII